MKQKLKKTMSDFFVIKIDNFHDCDRFAFLRDERPVNPHGIILKFLLKLFV